MGPFRRSGTFGIVGVLVVMAAVAVVARGADPRDASPKDTYALIFGIVAVFVVVLFALQLRDVSAAEDADARAFTAPPRGLENPATLDQAALWTAMAVKPVDEEAIRARRRTWSTTRSSVNTAIAVTALILLTVPPIYLFDTFVPLLIGGPLIAVIAGWKSIRLLAGGFGRVYDDVSESMAPLGLRVAERPRRPAAGRGRRARRRRGRARERAQLGALDPGARCLRRQRHDRGRAGVGRWERLAARPLARGAPGGGCR
jgi:hypothetical protein